MERVDLLARVVRNTADEAFARQFVALVPVIESLFHAFAKATGLPIWMLLDGTVIYASPEEGLQPFCRAMHARRETHDLCLADAARRAESIHGAGDNGVTLCHAGMAIIRRELQIHAIGNVVVLVGAGLGTGPAAEERIADAIRATHEADGAHAEALRAAADSTIRSSAIPPESMALMDEILGVISRLLAATVDFRSQTISMAHELSLMMLGLGLLTRHVMKLLEDAAKAPELKGPLSSILTEEAHVLSQSQLALYVVRNFLSHTSETRYKEVVRPRFQQVNIVPLVEEMVALHETYAASKEVTFQVDDLSDVPAIRGYEMELRRLLHNIINNAVKYSYHSTNETQRTIRIWARVPYDPGFRDRRFALCVENYGLGLTEAERQRVFQPGFRGRRAISEVPIGSGIGLSEATKIMKAHGGQLALESKPLHKEESGEMAYLTTVKMIFPYGRSGPQSEEGSW